MFVCFFISQETESAPNYWFTIPPNGQVWARPKVTAGNSTRASHVAGRALPGHHRLSLRESEELKPAPVMREAGLLTSRQMLALVFCLKNGATANTNLRLVTAFVIHMLYSAHMTHSAHT